MNKCSCYHAEENWLGLPGVCWGTKECEPCKCGGDESKCDFYPEKKKSKRLTSKLPLTESDAMNLSLTDLYIRLKAYEDAEEKGAVEMKKEIDDAYKRGAEDAWEATRKLALLPPYGGLCADEMKEVFGTSNYINVMMSVTPLEAIEKIRQYRNEFKVGDEVKDKFGFYAVVVGPKGSKEDESKMYVVFRDGSAGEQDKDWWTKTGRHFPQIAEVLGMMGEAMDE